MRHRNPNGRYIEGEIGKGNTHTKYLSGIPGECSAFLASGSD